MEYVFLHQILRLYVKCSGKSYESPEGPRPSVHIARAGKGTSGGSRLVGGGSQSVVVICHSTHEPGGRATHVSLYLHKDLYIDTSSDVGLYRPYVFLYRNVFTTAQRGYATTIQGLGGLETDKNAPTFFPLVGTFIS